MKKPPRIASLPPWWQPVARALTVGPRNAVLTQSKRLRICRVCSTGWFLENRIDTFRTYVPVSHSDGVPFRPNLILMFVPSSSTSLLPSRARTPTLVTLSPGRQADCLPHFPSLRQQADPKVICHSLSPAASLPMSDSVATTMRATTITIDSIAADSAALKRASDSAVTPSSQENYEGLSPRHTCKKVKVNGDHADKDHRTQDDAIPEPQISDTDHITLTSHPDAFGVDPIPISWGHPDPAVRGPIVCTVRHTAQRNAIGAHQGSYCIYTGLALAAGQLDPDYVPNLSLTAPVFKIGPYPSWSDPKKMASMDPFGHMITSAYGDWLDKGWDIRPTIAVTKAHIDLPECREAIKAGRLVPDGKILLPTGQSVCGKAAIEPVWYLPEIARRFQTTESNLRQSIFRMTNGMYPELVTRPDIKVFLPPIGGLTIYIWGDPDTIPDEDIELTCRVHDECNGSDVFGSDICTCRPYLTHAIEECIKTAQRGGCGIVIYFRKEGRSLGEVTKYLVYNTRKRQEGGDSAAQYFACTEKVAGVQDTRFQALMPDPLHFLGVTKIHNFISMSDMKYNAIVNTGIKIVNRVEIPPEMVPDDAQVEITAKVFHGYNAGKAYQGIDEESLKKTKGRDYNYDNSN